MTTPAPPYPQTPASGGADPVEPFPLYAQLAAWQVRLLAAVCQLRDQHKDAIIIYDHRTNTVRVIDARAYISLKIDA